MKTWKQFMAGMFTVALLASLIGTALAAGGKLQASTAGVVVQGQAKVEPGKSYTVGKQRIPAVVDYEAPNGKTYHYLPVQMYTDYLNIWNNWSKKQNSIVLGAFVEDTEDSGWSVEILDEEKELNATPRTAELGVQVGPFTEISPSLVDMTKKPTQVIDNKTRVQSITGYGSTGTFLPENGKYILLTITNNGKHQVRCIAELPYTLGVQEAFPNVAIEPGKTLTRAFQIAEGTTSAQFMYSVSTTLGSWSAPEGADVTVTFMQYR